MSFAHYPAGWAELCVTGPEPERFLTLLGEHGVPFRASPPEAFTCTLRVPARQVKKALALAASSGCEARVLSLHGLPRTAKRLRRRWLPAALIAALTAVLLWSQSFIWYIDVTGNEKVPDGVILQALEECGIRIGARWVGMHQDTVRNGVLLRVPGLRWMTVSMQGSRANVIVREAREKSEPVKEDEYAAILADRPGLVEHVYALRGTAVAEAGRFVLPGDAIIGGYATGRFGVQGPVRAEGWADVRTWYEITAAAPSELAVKKPTGEKTVRFALILGGRRINFSKDSSICPAECDKIIESYTLALPGVFTLPVAVEKTTVAAYTTERMDAAELPEELSAAAREALLDRLGDGGEIVSEAYAAWEADGLSCVTLEAECRERVGVSVPLSEGELASISAKIPRTEE